MEVAHKIWPGHKAMCSHLITSRDHISEFISYLGSYLCLKNARHDLKAGQK